MERNIVAQLRLFVSDLCRYVKAISDDERIDSVPKMIFKRRENYYEGINFLLCSE